LKYHKRETKYILKRALQGVLSNRVLHREKKGFGVPLEELMRGPFGSFVEENIVNSSLRHRELFNYEFVNHLISEHQAGRQNYSFFLWTLLNLSLWYERWIVGRSNAGQSSEPDVRLRA
jgi:asparagine synthase (glutamine-hydrolysing)